MEVILGDKDVSLVDLTYQEAEVIFKALDEYRCYYSQSSDSYERMSSKDADYLCARLDEALLSLDKNDW